MIGLILIIFFVVVLATVVLTLAMRITIIPKKPDIAGFSVDVVKEGDANPPHALTVPTIRFGEIAGNTLAQEYSQNTHSGINET